MNNIIKRRKTTEYAQINNDPLQNLEDIRAIGLMAHLMSLPENWEIRKMQLYRKFGRAAIFHAIEELEAKKYWISIKYRYRSSNDYIYYISDCPFKEDEVKLIIKEIQEENVKILEISIPFSNLILSNDQSEQFTFEKSIPKIQTNHLLNKIIKNKIIKNKIPIKEEVVNMPIRTDRLEIIKQLIVEYSLKGLSKSLCLEVLEEIGQKDKIYNFEKYFRTCLDTVLERVNNKKNIFSF